MKIKLAAPITFAVLTFSSCIAVTAVTLYTKSWEASVVLSVISAFSAGVAALMAID